MLDSSNFSDPKIVIICDDDVEPKGLKPTCVTKNGGVIFGQVLILATNNSLHDLCLLDLTQAKMVKEEVKLHPKKILVLRCGIEIFSNSTPFLPQEPLCDFTS